RDRGLGECGGRRIRWPPRIRRPRRWQRGLNHIGRRQAWIALPFRAAFDMPNKDTRAVEVVALYALRAYRSAEAVEIEPDASTSRLEHGRRQPGPFTAGAARRDIEWNRSLPVADRILAVSRRTPHLDRLWIVRIGP